MYWLLWIQFCYCSTRERWCLLTTTNNIATEQCFRCLKLHFRSLIPGIFYIKYLQYLFWTRMAYAHVQLSWLVISWFGLYLQHAFKAMVCYCSITAYFCNFLEIVQDNLLSIFRSWTQSTGCNCFKSNASTECFGSKQAISIRERQVHRGS